MIFWSKTFLNIYIHINNIQRRIRQHYLFPHTLTLCYSIKLTYVIIIYMKENIEKKIAIKNRKNNLKKIILQTVATVGIIGVSIVAPNVLVTMKKLGILPKNRQKEFIGASRERLIKNGYLKYENGNVRITGKGEVYLMKETAYEGFKNQKKKWDKKWRVLIFDIPEQKKTIREKIRLTLISIGFMRLQDSVWIYPYDCEDLITLLKADLKIGKDVLYMIVEALEYDKSVRVFFGLNK